MRSSLTAPVVEATARYDLLAVRALHALQDPESCSEGCNHMQHDGTVTLPFWPVW